MKLLTRTPDDQGQTVLSIANDVDLFAFHASNDDIAALHDWTAQIAKAQVIALHFPKFNDGRAFSQAIALRRRFGFQGVVRATGDVLVDQVQQMQRCGFDQAVLREDQSLATAEAQLARFGNWYQGDAQKPTPHFAP